MNRKIEAAKKKRTEKAQEQALIAKQISSQERLKDAIDGLYELLNGQEQYDFDKLHKQLVEIDKRLDLAPHFKSLEKSITTSHKPYDNKTKIEGFSELLRAVKTNQPIPSTIKLDKLEKAVVNIEQYIKEQSEPEDRGAENYKPVRRVVKMGNRFFFDDNMTSGGGGGSGGNTDGLTNAQLRASPVPVTATIDTAGLATSTKQSDGSQKTQIVDSGGEAATVTGGKLDVNATASLAGTALPIAGATEGVGVAIVDGSGNQITSFGGGVQYTEGDTDASVTGTAVMWEDGSDTMRVASAAKPLPVVQTGTPGLPTGASTAAKQETGNTSLASIDGKITAVNTGAVVVSSSALPSGAATSAKQDTQITAEQAIQTSVELIDDTVRAEDVASADGHKGVVQMAVRQDTPANTSGTDGDYEIPKMSGGRMWVDASGKTLTVDGSGVTQPVSAASLPLPSGAATSAKQDTLIGHVDGLEALATTIDADTSNISTKIDTIAGAVSGSEMQVDVVSSALPSGAATAAKQPALGTAGTSSADVITVQGRAGMTALLTDGSATTQPVSNAGLTELAAAINSDKLDINLKTSDIAFGGTSAADDADFTAGTTPGTPSMGVYESTPTSVTDGDLGTVGITAGRRLKTSATIDAALPAGTNNIGDVDVVSMPTTTVQATNLDIRDLTNADVVTAELSATDNAVLDAIAASTAAIDTDTTTLIGHVDGVETAIASTNTKLDTVNTNLTTIDGRVDGLETSNSAIQTSVQLMDDVVATLGTTTYTEASTKGNIIGAVRRDANTTLVDTTNEVAPLQVNATGELKVAQIQALPAGTNAIGKLAANDGVDIGDVTINNSTGGSAVNIQDGGNSITVDYATTGSGTATGALRVELPTNGTGVVGLNAGTNAIGKLAANSGVDIGDVDVTSAVSATMDHGSNRDIDTAAEQITATSFACKFGVTLKADAANTGILYIGNSDVTAGTTAATDGIPLAAGESITLPLTNSNIPYAIASANNQVIYWTAV